MDISIVILNYKSKGHTLNCIKSIEEADFILDEKKITYEIIVVDNDSGDSIGEVLNWQHPNVEFIQNNKNLGMGAGNNVGIKKAKGDWILILNNDTVLNKNFLKELNKNKSSSDKPLDNENSLSIDLPWEVQSYYIMILLEGKLGGI